MTTATLPKLPPVAVTAESARAGHVLWAGTGRCARNHDITDLANVYRYRLDNGRIQLGCLPCRRIRDNERRQNYTSANFPALTCHECGNRFSKPDDLDITLRGWLRREFCSDDCKVAATVARRTVGAGIDSADVEWSLARCEGVVRSSEDDVFFEPDGAIGRPTAERVAAARRYCVACPIAVGCLQYAIDRNISTGVWGGADASERRKLVERLGREAQARTTAEVSG